MAKPRLPNKWTAEEDETLRKEVESQPSGPEDWDWCQIAEKLPGRTNKDCRKRWYNAMAAEFRKGPWTHQEDEQLKKAVVKNGTRWTVVARTVKSRSAEQCAKRWQHSLNPNLDHSEWTEREDQNLMDAVKAVGRQWTQIQQMYFPERSKNAIKNRHTILCRKLRRQIQDKQRSEGASRGPVSSDEESDGLDDDGREEGSSDQEDMGLGWVAGSSEPTLAQTMSPGSRSTNSTTGGMHDVFSDSSWNYLDPMLPGTSSPMYKVPAGSSSLSTTPWVWDASPVPGIPPFLEAGSDSLMHNSDSPFLDLMMTGPGASSTSSDNRSLPSTGVDCAMPWECPGEIETSCEDIVAAGTLSSRNTVAVNLTLDNPDFATMESLMRIAIENKAKFRVERQ